jgi:RNA polymerase sigma-70 factor (ECF subfamily)
LSNTDDQYRLQSDAELIGAINSGDGAAFEALYLRYRDWVVRLAYRFTGNHDDALDVLQETFSYLLRKTPKLRLTAAMTSFLYPAVKNLSLGAIRRRGRCSGHEFDGLLDQVAAPALREPSADRAALAEVLQNLSGAQREVLLLRFVDGMSLEEIARAVQIPLGTVKSRIHNALETLRQDPRTRGYFQS